MPGDVRLGAVLRELREARGLTLAAVARQAGCTASLVSYVETGQRQVLSWLADELDRIYGTGSVVASLARGTAAGTPDESSSSSVPGSDVFLVLLPQGGVAMPLSRREVLTALGLGIISGKLQCEFERALDDIRLDGSLLPYFENAFQAFQEAARIMRPADLIDGMMGNIAILDGLRRRAIDDCCHGYSNLQARYAEALSWLSEEAGNLSGAMYWIDRASQWAQSVNWPGMVAYGFIRRSMVVISFSGHGRRAVDQARHVLDIPQASPYMKGLAAKQMAFGYALADDRDNSRRALDEGMARLAQPGHEDDAAVGQRSVIADDLYAVYRMTCEVYLGQGARVIPELELLLESLARSSRRTATITRAKLARAYANAGQPEPGSTA